MNEYVVKVGPGNITLLETNADNFNKFYPADMRGIPCFFTMQNGVPKVWPKPAEGVVVYQLVAQPVL